MSRVIVTQSVAWLGRGECHDCVLLGGKASNLFHLAAEHRVPPGFCLTADAVDHALATGRLADEDSAPASLPSELLGELVRAYQGLGERCGLYDHSQGCSITGGPVSRGEALPEWQGIYIYGDYCQGNVWVLLRQANGSLNNTLHEKLPAYITAFGQDEVGELYLVDIGGEIFKLVRK